MESGRVKGWNWKCKLSLALGSHQMGDLRSLSRHRVGAYPETSSHATGQGTFGHCRLSSLSHCGLILISGGKWIVERSPPNPLKRWESHYQAVGQQRENDNENSVWLIKNTYFFVTSQFFYEYDCIERIIVLLSNVNLRQLTQPLAAILRAPQPRLWRKQVMVEGKQPH